MNLPDARKVPCAECPWRRVSVPGWLGPMTVAQWFAAVHSDEPIACHLTITSEFSGEPQVWEQPGVMQCAGAAQYRTNVCKSPRDPAVATADEVDTTHVFGYGEFIAHHGATMDEVRAELYGGTH